MSLAEQWRGKRVGVIVGGPSSEREVSLKTGRGVLAALLQRGFDAVAIDWRAGESLPAALQQERVEVAWIALHGVWGEDGCVQGLLECMGIPYTGAGVLGSAMAMDKIVAKHLFEAAGVPVAAWCVARTPEELRRIPLPVVVKPSREGSSVGVTIVHEEAQLDAAFAEARRHHGEVIVEEYVRGHEIQVGVLDDAVLGEVEIRPAVEFYDYEAKYQRNDTQYLCPAPISDDDRRRIAEVGLLAHRTLQAGTYSRVDLILSETGRVVCLEVNTLPGMTDKSLLPKIAASAGCDYATLVERILAGASLKA